MPLDDFKNNKFLKYSGLAIQIFVSIAIAAYFGKWLDHKLEMSKPIFTALCGIGMLILLFVWLNYDLKNQEK